MDSVRLQFTISEDEYGDYARACFTRLSGFWTRHFFKIFVTAGAIITLAGVNWIFVIHRNPYYGGLTTLCGLYLIWRGWWVPNRQWRSGYRRARPMFTDVEAEITETGLRTKSATAELLAEWEHFTGFAETQKLIMLGTPERTYLLLPKRAFQPAELDRAQEWIRAKLPVVSEKGRHPSTE